MRNVGEMGSDWLVRPDQSVPNGPKTEANMDGLCWSNRAALLFLSANAQPALKAKLLVTCVGNQSVPSIDSSQTHPC